MTIEEEIDEMNKMRLKLATASGLVHDVFNWFEKNEASLYSRVDFDSLEDIADSLDEMMWEVKHEIDELKLISEGKSDGQAG